jgi:hypothetical protein
LCPLCIFVAKINGFWIMKWGCKIVLILVKHDYVQTIVL